MLPDQQPHVNWNDEKSFEQVYLLYFKKLYRLCYFHIQDVEESKEIVHDLFHALWERRNSLTIQSSVEGYLTKAIKLKICHYLRDKISDEKHLSYAASRYPVSEDHTENAFLYNILSELIDQLTEQLPQQCGKVFVLSRKHGMRNSDIASLLKISEKAVEHQITRALAFFRKELMEYR